MRIKFIFMGILAVITALGLVAGCGINQGSEEQVLVELSIGSDQFTAKTIEPGISMKLLEYMVQVTPETVTPTNPVKTKIAPKTGTGTPVSFLLTPGKHTFQAFGYNAITTTPQTTPRDLIGQSDVTGLIDIAPKNLPNPSITLTVQPLLGTGNVRITIDWTRVTYDFNANAQASLSIYNKNTTSFDDADRLIGPIYAKPLPSVNKVITIESSGIPTGYYKCRIQLFDDKGTTGFSDDALLWTGVDTLRSVAAKKAPLEPQISTASYFLSRQLDTIVQVSAMDDMQNALGVNFNIIINNVQQAYILWDQAPPDFFTIVKPTDQFDVQAVPVDRYIAGYPPVAVEQPNGAYLGGYEWYINGNYAGTGFPPVYVPSGGNSYSQYTLPSSGFNAGPYELTIMVKKAGEEVYGSRTLLVVVEDGP